MNSQKEDPGMKSISRILALVLALTLVMSLGSTAMAEKDSLRIGLARSTSPAGPWKVCPHPVLEARKDNFDNTIVTNPAPCVLPDGRIYLYYRTNTPGGARIGLAIYEDPEGPALRM